MRREVKRAETSCNLSFLEDPWPQAVIRRMTTSIYVTHRPSVAIVEALGQHFSMGTPSKVKIEVFVACR